MPSKPMIIKTDFSGIPLSQSNPRENEYTESWLQELLHTFPQILPVEEIEEVFTDLVPIGREVATKVGYIDNLFISIAGYPVIVETKLWRNNEAKREVVAQAIDYAAEFSKWTFEDLDQVCKRYAGKGVIELIEEAINTDIEEPPTDHDIARNLKMGRVLLLIVSDEIRRSLIGMMEFINKFPHLSANIGLVELRTYKMPESDGDLLVIPNLIAKTEIVERSVVQVHVLPDINHTITVEQKKVEPLEARKRRQKSILSDDAFWEKFSQNSRGGVEKAKEIQAYFEQFDEIEMGQRQVAIVSTMYLPETNQPLSLFYINIDGTLSCAVTHMERQVNRTNLSHDDSQQYYQELASLFHQSANQKTLKKPINMVDTQAFIDIVERFIHKVLTSEVD